MARSQSDLQVILTGLDGVQAAYFQPGQNVTIQDPCIVYERDDSWAAFADNVKHLLKKRYTVTVVDRMPDSPIPDQVENLPYSRFDRFFVANGLNHFVFQLFF
jgi:hypothetical protein